MRLNKSLAATAVATAAACSFAQAIPPANLTQNTTITVQNVTAATACSATFMIGGTTNTSSMTYTSGATTGTSGGGGNGFVNISCNGNQPVSWVASAGAGNNANGSTRRAATSGATPAYINYQLTKTPTPPSTSTIFDATVPAFGGANITGSTSGTSGSNNGSFNYFVDVPAGQLNLTAGTYTDSVAITVTF